MDLRLAVLGDSIAFGQGATRPEDRLSSRLVRGLQDAAWTVRSRVVAVPGARSAGLAAQVDLVEEDAPDVAVVVIGANDLTHFTPVDRAAAALEDALRRLRSLGTEVVVAPAPDMSAVPLVPVQLRPVVREVSLRLRAAQAAAIRRHGAWLADPAHTTSAAFEADASLFSADHFHPSSEGYAVIAAALLPVVLDAAEAVRATRTGAA
ncbi:MAG TPA: SGNH/GDSL hydrolase family protein [Nocardioides sp.]|nr:SGNH/GDSL hydrolase family protein [Nocardioides sp.]